MEHLWTLGVGILLALGGASYYAAWMLHRHPGRAGWWLSPLVGHVYTLVILGSVGFLLAWIHDAGQDDIRAVLARAGVSLLCLMLQLPFVNYHVGDFVSRRLTGQALADNEPTDSFQRAQLAEQRGDARGAIEQYSLIIKHDPLHTRARICLAEVLAGSRRMAQAQEIVRCALKFDDLPDADRGELTALLLRWEDRGPGAIAPEGPGHVVRAVTTARMEAHDQLKANSPDADDAIETGDE
jgi:hypothetical protein